MRIDFDERFALSAAEVYAYFETPRDWTRLYGLMGEVADLGGGWYSVPLKRFPFPLVAQNTSVDPGHLVRWRFRGFWRGRAEIRFTESNDGLRVVGFEEVSVRYLGFLSPLVEKLLLERTFNGIWNSGWRRLRRQAERKAHDSRGECSREGG
jgi:hypothetical protein